MGGIILGAMGGAGAAMQDVGSTMMKSDLALDNEKTMAGVRSDLETQRAKTLEEFKQSLQNAPLNRLGAKAKEFADQDVPQEAAPVTRLTGAGVTDSSGLQGDPKALRAQVMKWPDGPDKTQALAQLDSQFAADTEINKGVVRGQMRKRTADEALAAAADDAKVNDLPAYAAYEKDIGKPRRDERRVDIQQEREDNRAASTAQAEQRRADAEQRRWIMDAAKLDLQQGNQDLQAKRIDALIEHWERGDETKANGKAGTPERMTSIVNSMNTSIRDLDANKPRSDASADEKSAWQAQRANAIAVRARAMQKLNSNFDDAGAPPLPVPPASPASSTRPPLSQFFK